MNYKAIFDGECSTIEPTSEETDGATVFTSLREARNMLLSDLSGRITGLRNAQNHVRSLRVAAMRER